MACERVVEYNETKLCVEILQMIIEVGIEQMIGSLPYIGEIRKRTCCCAFVEFS
jgi:hypothetical protein